MEPLFKLRYSPTAGYIPDMTGGFEPGRLSADETIYIKDLAKKVDEISKHKKQKIKRDLWYRHNGLEKTRPLILVFPEDSWFEIIDIGQLKINDVFWRQYEWYLKHLLYRNEKFDDDFVIEADIFTHQAISSTGFGINVNYTKTSRNGSFSWDPPIKENADIKKLKTPEYYQNENLTRKRFDAVSEVLGDILTVKRNTGCIYDVNLIGEATTYRGIAQLMLDMYDRPEWLHEYMEFFTQASFKKFEFFEKNNLLSLNNRNNYTDSGGIGYTRELPGPDFDEKAIKLKNVWGMAIAQEFSEVSPEHHEEFCLNYQKRILKLFGLVSYGCCEPLTRKFDMIFKMPNLRRISVSPWCDIETAAEKLKDNYIYSWKPNPSMLIENYDEDLIRLYVRDFLSKTENNIVEIILKDVITIKNEPWRLSRWIEIVREEIGDS
ncbi:MAG: hypothetical protein ACYCYI_03345 [Saccharofermentanales bacterium]